MKTILAVDPSLAGTGVVIGNRDDYRATSISSKPSGRGLVPRFARFEQLVADVLDYVGEAEPDLVLVEGYSMASQGAGVIDRVEFGGLLRWHLLDLGREVWEVPPSTLKKFVTGSGQCKKEFIVAHLTRRYGVVFPTSDYYDAFGLFRMGLAILGDPSALLKYEAEAIATVKRAQLPANKPTRATKGSL